jgi:LacI family transcriptional regulator, galactose operon repressor
LNETVTSNCISNAFAERLKRAEGQKLRSTILDIAREAGVSPATVDRVLNNRPGVKLRTKQVVLAAAQKLDYSAETEGGPVALNPTRIKLHFALPAGANAFISTFRRQIEILASARPELDVSVLMIEGFSPDSLARTLRELEGRTDAVGVIALDHPTVREAIRSLAASGVKVATVVSDISHVPRIAYIGIDNRAAGRLAGYLLSRFIGARPHAKVALLAGSLSYRGHEEREMGFRHILAEEFPTIEIVEIREMLDDQERAYSEASALLEKHPDLAAIYNVGAGSMGIARALKMRNLQSSIVFVGHDATEDTKSLLLDGTMDAVIDQNPRVEARESLNILAHAVLGTSYEGHPPRLQVIFKENIPEV